MKRVIMSDEKVGRVMLVADKWKDYTLLDASCGEKLEQWKNITLLRPDPQIIWNNGNLIDTYASSIHAWYHRNTKGGGYWENLKKVPKQWTVCYQDLRFCIKQMGFKHTGLFPEQAVNWDFMMSKIKNSNRPIKVLNLFGYTGAATCACLKAGASVVHVDSSRGMVDWCRENVKENHLENKSIRYIVDDVLKFVKREIRRGNHYDAIVMDPPSYGRGANGEVWNIEQNLLELVSLCTELLSDTPLFFLINSYTAGLSSQVLKNLLLTTVALKYQGKVSCGEVGLPIQHSDLVLPCGIYGRWEE